LAWPFEGVLRRFGFVGFRAWGKWTPAIRATSHFSSEVHQFVDDDRRIFIVAQEQEPITKLGIMGRVAHPVVDDLDEIVGIFDFERGISVVEELPGEFLLGHDAAECVEDDGAVEVERLGASRRAAPCDDDIAGLHEQMDVLGESFNVAGKLRVLGSPLHKLVIGVVVFPADDDGLAAVRVAQECRKELKVVVGAIGACRQKHGETVWVQSECLLAKLCFGGGGDDFEVSPWMHEMAAHQGLFRGDSHFDGKIAGRGRTRDVEISGRFDPVSGVPPSAGKLTAIGRAAHLICSKNLTRELKVSAVEAVVNAKNEVRPVLA